MSRTAPTYKNDRYPIEIVARAVWLYFRFDLSLRDVEEMLLGVRHPRFLRDDPALVLNYFLRGEFRAYQARDRSYAGPNMDLGVEYAEMAGWSADQVETLRATDKKIARKMSTRTPSGPSQRHPMPTQWNRNGSAS